MADTEEPIKLFRSKKNCTFFWRAAANCTDRGSLAIPLKFCLTWRIQRASMKRDLWERPTPIGPSRDWPEGSNDAVADHSPDSAPEIIWAARDATQASRTAGLSSG
jgi:hypothetical protein